MKKSKCKICKAVYCGCRCKDCFVLICSYVYRLFFLSKKWKITTYVRARENSRVENFQKLADDNAVGVLDEIGAILTTGIDSRKESKKTREDYSMGSRAEHVMRSNLMKKSAVGQSKRDNKEGIRSINTMKQYLSVVDRYAKWLKENNISARTLEKCASNIQTYLDSLRDKGLSATSIHTYASALAKATNTKLDDYNIPLRTERLTRSRMDHGERSDQLVKGHERLVNFAKVVGIRREEYSNLRGDNLRRIDGRLFVIVEQGKGGKYQEQAIRPQDEALVMSYFDGKHESRVFSEAEMKNKIDLHGIRAEHAREVYKERVDLYNKHPDMRVSDFDTLKNTFSRNHKNWKSSPDMRILSKDLYSIYHTRGCVREQLKSEGRQLDYDRLATMVVSVENLAHYRCDVTVGHYFR